MSEAYDALIAEFERLANTPGNSPIQASRIHFAEWAKLLKSNRATIITVYAVHQGDDDRSFGHPAWYFTDNSRATNVAKGRGWYGGNAPVTDKKVLKIGDTAYLLDRDTPIRLDVGPEDYDAERKNALAKLTDYEKKLLGIK